MEIDSEVLRIWDRTYHLLTKVVRGSNNFYVLYAKVAQLGTKEMVWGKMVDGGPTSMYNNFNVNYVYFEGAGGAGSSSALSVPTLVLRSQATKVGSSLALVSPPSTPTSTPLGVASTTAGHAIHSCSGNYSIERDS